jgi:putative aldouronate transport system substrate-binding protein
LEAIYLSIYPELSNIERGWIKEDNRWIPVYASKKTGKALSQAKELYDLGLLDKSFPYRSINQAFSLFIDEKAGAICCQYFSLLKYWNSIDGIADDTKDIIVLKPWPAEDGQTYRFTSSLHWSETYFSSNVSDEKMAKIMEIFNYLLSDEADELFYHGGDDQWIDQNPSIDILSYLVSWEQEKIYDKTPYSIKIYGEENIDYANEMIEWYKRNTKKVDYNYDIMFSNIPDKYLLPTYNEIQNEMIQIIIGEADAATAWSEVMEKYNNKIFMKNIFNKITESVDQDGLE